MAQPDSGRDASMLKWRRAWPYALLASLGGVLLTWSAYATGVGVSLFFGPVVPVLRLSGLFPPPPTDLGPDELPFGPYEAFLAFFSAAVFWVIIFPLIVWLVTALYLRSTKPRSANRA